MCARYGAAMVSPPVSLIDVAVEPRSKADQEKLGVALALLVNEDPSFRVSTDHESGQLVLHGLDEGHLDAKLEFLIHDRQIGLNVGAPQVAYRESLGKVTD